MLLAAISGCGVGQPTRDTTKGVDDDTATTVDEPYPWGPEGCDSFGFSCPSVEVSIDVAGQRVPVDTAVNASFVAEAAVPHISCQFDDLGLVVEGVAGTVVVDVDGAAITFTPDDPLVMGNTYDVVAGATLVCWPNGGNACSWYCPAGASAWFTTVIAR